MPPHVRRGGTRGRSNTPRHAVQARAALSAGRSAPRTQGKFAAFDEFCNRLRVLQIRRRRHLRPAQKRAPTSVSQVVDSALDGDEPAINVSMKDFVSVWDRRLEVPWTSRFLCQGGGAGESALAICCHDRRPRSPTFGGIAPSAEVLLDETGSAAGIFARHRCGRTYQDLNFAIRQYPEQAETEPSTQVAKPGVALTPLPARRGRAASQTSSLVVARSTPCKMS